MAASWITPPQTLSPTADSNWHDVDVSAYVPAGATGVILHFRGGTPSGYFGFRKNGSTDNRQTNGLYLSHSWFMVGVDANRIFELLISSTSHVTVILVGYVTSDAVFLTNGVAKAPANINGWYDLDCSAEAPGAIGIIFETLNTSVSYLAMGLRQNSSTDARVNTISYRSCMGAVVGCDGSQVVEAYRASTGIYFWLLGYVTSAWTFNTNAVDISMAGTGAWADLSALPAGATGGVIEVISTLLYAYGLQRKGDTENIFDGVKGHDWGVVAADADQLVQGKIEHLSVDFFLVGYSTAGDAPAAFVPRLAMIS